MKAALLLVDLQHDFLARQPLEPAPEQLVARASALLGLCREHQVPVVHVRMTITRDPDNRLPHWKSRGEWICVEGTPGHAAPSPLHPQPSETVIDKQGFSAFEDGRLEALLDGWGTDTVILGGLDLHNCIRATAVDAWCRHRDVIIAEDATGHYDPLEAASTSDFLSTRGVRFLPVRSLGRLLLGAPAEEQMAPDVPCLPARMPSATAAPGGGPHYVHRSPGDISRVVWSVAAVVPEEVTSAVRSARNGLRTVTASTVADRCRWLESLASTLAGETVAARLATWIATDVGKPVREARTEIGRCRQLLAAAVRHAGGPFSLTFADGSGMRRVPHGVVAAITPWNHPLAIPVGKIAPAVLHGNTVVWKPAPAGARLAVELLELMRQAGWPAGLVTVVQGGAAAACSLMNDPGVDAITLTGGPAAGFAARRLAALRPVPLQAELGGNNAAIVWSDADPAAAARLIAAAAFGFAGQRCTANRRVIIGSEQLDFFLERLVEATRELAWGDPLDEATVVGPLVSEDSRDRVTAALAAAEAGGHRVLRPHGEDRAGFFARGWYHAPAIVVCDDPEAGIVRRESFGPVLVVQPAADWDHAVELANGVEQGLAASVFTASAERWADFQNRVRVGILKWNRATAEAGVEAPFGGWKASGIGPPEHGPANLEFYTRSQTLYEG